MISRLFVSLQTANSDTVLYVHWRALPGCKPPSPNLSLNQSLGVVIITSNKLNFISLIFPRFLHYQLIHTSPLIASTANWILTPFLDIPNFPHEIFQWRHWRQSSFYVSIPFLLNFYSQFRAKMFFVFLEPDEKMETKTVLHFYFAFQSKQGAIIETRQTFYSRLFLSLVFSTIFFSGNSPTKSWLLIDFCLQNLHPWILETSPRFPVALCRNHPVTSNYFWFTYQMRMTFHCHDKYIVLFFESSVSYFSIKH